MPLQIIRNDIIDVECDAIVNTTDNVLSGSGSGDAAIHIAAGPKLREACEDIVICPTGYAVITPGFNLKCKYVIHTAGPVWLLDENPEVLLRCCYRNSLELASVYNCKSIAFPLISSGTNGCPKDIAIKIAVEVITEFLLNHEIMIFLVVYDDESTKLGKRIYPALEEYIDNNYIESHSKRRDAFPKSYRTNRIQTLNSGFEYLTNYENIEKLCINSSEKGKGDFNLADLHIEPDESFSQMLMRLLVEKDLNSSDVYKRANIDKRLFSKIIGKHDYHPSKNTCQALSIALKLPFLEAQEFLSKAGYTFTHSSKTDIVIEYFMNNGNYDIFDINIHLFNLHLETLGSK